MQSSSIVGAIKQICAEKGISYESVVETLNAALAAAFRKDFGQKNQNIKVEFDPETGKSRAFDVKIVVTDELAEIAAKEAEERAKKLEALAAEQGVDISEVKFESEPYRYEQEDAEENAEDGEVLRFNPKLHITLTDAQDIKSGAVLGDEIKIELEIPGEFGRMAAQTAKQVITQRLREAERENVFNDFKGKEHNVVTAVVQRVEGNTVLVDLGRTTGVMLPDGQIPKEHYNTGDRVRVYVSDVRMTSKGPEIIVSRTSPEIVRELFMTEIPEVANGSIEIKAISREAGSRSKVAVFTEQENIDPIGSCVGQRGTRVQTIISELSGEKLDIIEYSEDPKKFIANALLPAKIVGIMVNEAEKSAVVSVVPDQLSLAIGKAGQNVRLAAKLTGWKINIAEATASAIAEKAEEEEKTTSDVGSGKVKKSKEVKEADAKDDVATPDNQESSEE